MVVMTGAAPSQASWLPRGRTWVADDLDAAPDDGHRYELLDGALVVSAAPIPLHQQVVVELAYLLRQGCPADLRVYVAPLDVRLSDDTVLQPDVVVARRGDVGATNLPAAPVLAIEVLSPSTRSIDLMLKHDRLARAGCPSYWALDPEGAGRLLAWELDSPGHYRPVADVSGTESWTATLPYPVTITPQDLLA